jgi:hypothetical protein
MENIRIGSYNINKKAYYEVDFKWACTNGFPSFWVIFPVRDVNS